MKESFKYILTGVLLALLALGIAACKTEEERLSAPTNLQVSETDILTWDEVEGAKSYVVTIDEEEYEAKTNTLDIFLLTTEPKTYDIKVAAYDSNYRLTAWSDSVNYTVPEQPEFKFEPTDDGQGYRIEPSGKTLVCVIFGLPVYHYDGKSYGVGKVIVPSTYNGKPVKEIASVAFQDCEGLTELILPDTIENVGEEGFRECANLRRVRLPAYLETMEIGAFNNCKALKEIDLPEGLRTIRVAAFRGCESLERIEIPSAVERIADSVFELCLNLKSITVDDRNDTFRSEGNCIIRKSDGALIMGCNASVIPQGVLSIREKAFSNCTELTEIKVPASVTKIGVGAFENCSMLEKVEFSSGIKTIYSNAFKGCTALKSVRLPDTLETVESNSFPREMEVTIDKNNPYLKADGNCIIRKSDGALIVGCNASVIPQGVLSIRYDAFSECKELKEIKIPASVTKIESGAFWNCSKLEKVKFSSGIKTIYSNAFKGCTALKSVRFPDTLETIESNSFPREMEVTIDKNNPYLKADGNCIVRKSDGAVIMEFSFPVLSD